MRRGGTRECMPIRLPHSPSCSCRVQSHASIEGHVLQDEWHDKRKEIAECTPEEDEQQNSSCSETLWFNNTQLQSFELLQTQMRGYAMWSLASACLAVGRIVKTYILSGVQQVRKLVFKYSKHMAPQIDRCLQLSLPMTPSMHVLAHQLACSVCNHTCSTPSLP